MDPSSIARRLSLSSSDLRLSTHRVKRWNQRSALMTLKRIVRHSIWEFGPCPLQVFMECATTTRLPFSWRVKPTSAPRLSISRQSVQALWILSSIQAESKCLEVRLLAPILSKWWSQMCIIWSKTAQMQALLSTQKGQIKTCLLAYSMRIQIHAAMFSKN